MMRGFIGLDLETSGTDHKESAPIQIGLAYFDKKGNPHYWRSYIGGWNWVKSEQLYRGHRGFGDHVWTPEAADVHGIPKSRLVTAPRRLQVDQNAQAWLDDLPDYDGSYKLIPVGWNVRGFDMPFIKQHTPHLYKRFQRRQVDLNSFVFSIDKMGLYKPTGGIWKFSTAKRVAKERAAQRTKLEYPSLDWHDAGFDALAGLYAWEELQKMVKEAKLIE